MNFLEKYLEDPVRFAWVRRGFYVVLTIVALVEIIGSLAFHDNSETHFWFESFPAWGSTYGLISCVAIILVSKLIGKLWLMRRDDYYDD